MNKRFEEFTEDEFSALKRGFNIGFGLAAGTSIIMLAFGYFFIL